MTHRGYGSRYVQINAVEVSGVGRCEPCSTADEPILLQMPRTEFTRLSPRDGMPAVSPLYRLDNYPSPSPGDLGFTVQSMSYHAAAMPWPSISMPPVMDTAAEWVEPGTRGLLFNGFPTQSLEADAYVRLIDTALPRVVRSGVFAVDPADNRWVIQPGDLGLFDYIEYDGIEQLQDASRSLADRLIGYADPSSRPKTITGVIWNVSHQGDHDLASFFTLDDAMKGPADQFDLPMVGADIFADGDARTAVSMLLLGT